jgi:hypothetical protein
VAAPLFLHAIVEGCRLMGVVMPETRYARSGDVMVAYQVLGEAPLTWSMCPAPSPM